MQGVKRGIMEMADLILVNKADGDLKPAALRTMADYAGALRLLRRRPQRSIVLSAAGQLQGSKSWADHYGACLVWVSPR